MLWELTLERGFVVHPGRACWANRLVWTRGGLVVAAQTVYSPSNCRSSWRRRQWSVAGRADRSRAAAAQNRFSRRSQVRTAAVGNGLQRRRRRVSTLSTRSTLLVFNQHHPDGGRSSCLPGTDPPFHPPWTEAKLSHTALSAITVVEFLAVFRVLVSVLLSFTVNYQRIQCLVVPLTLYCILCFLLVLLTEQINDNDDDDDDTCRVVQTLNDSKTLRHKFCGAKVCAEVCCGRNVWFPADERSPWCSFDWQRAGQPGLSTSGIAKHTLLASLNTD